MKTRTAIVAHGESRWAKRSHITGAAVLILTIVVDQVRLVLPGQPALVTAIPFLTTLCAAAASVLSGELRHMPSTLRALVWCSALLAGYGISVSLMNGMPLRQAILGCLSYLNFVPAVLLSHQIGCSKWGEGAFERWAERTLLVVAAMVFLQQLGWIAAGEVLEKAPEYRGINDLRFRYSTGPFRTGSILSVFVAFVTSILVCGNVTRQHQYHRRLALVGLALVASILAARRSGLVMLLAAVVPFLFYSIRRQRLRLLSLALPVLMFGLQAWAGVDETTTTEVEAKVIHNTVNFDVSDRAALAVNIRDRDWEILSPFGEGMGAYGAAPAAMDAYTMLQAEHRRALYPVVHYGWFQDLAALGPLGALLYFCIFLLLMVAVYPTKEARASGVINWPGFSITAAAVVVHYFIATSWLQSITGGLSFGLAVGYASGRLQLAKANYHAQRMHHPNSLEPT